MCGKGAMRGQNHDVFGLLRDLLEHTSRDYGQITGIEECNARILG